MLTIGVDIDGVLADFNVHLANYISGRGEENDRGRRFPVPSGWDFKDWELSKPFPEYYMDFVKSGAYRSMPVMMGSHYVLDRIRQQGHKVVLITNRGASVKLTPELNKCAILDTMTWLEIEQIPYDSICFVQDKTIVHTDVLVEDSPQNLTDLSAQNRRLIVFHHAYNSHIPTSSWTSSEYSKPQVDRAYNWHDVGKLLDLFIEESELVEIPF